MTAALARHAVIEEALADAEGRRVLGDEIARAIDAQLNESSPLRTALKRFDAVPADVVPDFYVFSERRSLPPGGGGTAVEVLHADAVASLASKERTLAQQCAGRAAYAASQPMSAMWVDRGWQFQYELAVW